jgi:hypothetical protein
MAKIYALAQQVKDNASIPSLKARLGQSEEPMIRCSDCGLQVPLMTLGSHICDAMDRKPSPASTPTEEEKEDSLFRKNAKAAGLKIMTAAARSYSG